MKLAKQTGTVVTVFIGLIALYACSQSVGVVIGVEPPKDRMISFDRQDGVVVPCDTSLAVSVDAGFDAYSWWLDGEALLGDISRTVSVDCSSLSLGTHSLSVLVEDQGLWFTDTLRFRVEN